MTTVNKFIKLSEHQDWGTIYYARKGKGEGFGSDEYGTNSYKRGIKLNVGMAVAVKWPDGIVDTLPLTSRPSEGSYGDMGNTYEYETEEYGFEVDYHGVKVWVGLEEVKVRLKIGTGGVLTVPSMPG